MNKKQKGLIVLWCIVTALAAWSILVALQIDEDPARRMLGLRADMAHVYMQTGTVWVAVTLILSGLFWVFSDKTRR